jgi:hypothetical protein
VTISERLRARREQAEALNLRITGWVLTEDEWMAIHDLTIARYGGEEAASKAVGLSPHVTWYYRGESGLPIAGIRGLFGKRGITRNPELRRRA